MSFIDLKLEALIPDRSYAELRDDAIKTERLRPVVAAFASNMMRVDFLSLLPPGLAVWAWMNGRTGGREGTQTINSPEYQTDSTNMWWFQSDGYDPKIFRRRMIEGVMRVDGFVNAFPDGKAHGIQAWLASLPLSVWTAFETLAADLWREAVNCHPATLSQLAGVKEQPGKGDGGRMIPISLLEKYNYNVGAVMGTLLVDMDKVRFSKLETIRTAYALAFLKVEPKICSLLDNPALDDLTIMRNFIIHDAGVCGAEYLEKIEKRKHLPQLRKGERLQLDGESVKKLVDPVFDCCQQLIKAVDRWLDNRLSSQGDRSGI